MIAGAALLAVVLPSSAANATARATVSLRHTRHGTVLVTTNGHALYDFTRDLRDRSRCSAACQQTWPALMSASRPSAGPGVNRTHLGRTASGQVTYYGHPLYTYAGDTRAGQTHGEDLDQFGGRWYLLNATGRQVT